MADERNTLDAWTDVVCRELGITQPIDRTAILDVTKDVAHGVARPAAPLTAYLLGVAVGAGRDPAEVAERVARLARAWPESRGADGHPHDRTRHHSGSNSVRRG